MILLRRERERERDREREKRKKREIDRHRQTFKFVVFIVTCKYQTHRCVFVNREKLDISSSKDNVSKIEFEICLEETLFVASN